MGEVWSITVCRGGEGGHPDIGALVVAVDS